MAGDVDGLVEAAEFADFLQILCGWPPAGAATPTTATASPTNCPPACTKPLGNASPAYLESNEGRKAIIALHVDGIIDFINQRAKEPL